ncbi:MAG: ATP-grasp domain-containing protein, partial [Gammaproteobacteria bacterium]
MKNQTLLVVGGGTNQMPLVQAALNLGLRVAVSDINENPPCKELAHEYAQINTVDRGLTLQFARKLNVGAVVSDQTDAAVPTVAFIAEEMNLPGIGFETSLRFTNKHLMRNAVTNGQFIRSPEVVGVVKHIDELAKFRKLISPSNSYIVKPINSQGSKGVSRFEGYPELKLVQYALEESRGKGIIIESFIDGDEYSVESFVVDHKVHLLAVTKKYHYPQNDCIDFRNTYLNDIPIDIEKLLSEANKETIRLLDLNNGMTHAEYKISNGMVFLIEIAARGGGGNISGKIIPYLTGFDVSSALLMQSFGETPEVVFNDYRIRSAIMRFFNFKKGTVKAMDAI